MSRAKCEQERLEEMHSAATEIAVKAGELQRCATCETAFGLGDSESAFEAGLVLMKRGDDLADAFEGDAEGMRKAIERAIEEAPEECRCGR